MPRLKIFFLIFGVLTLCKLCSPVRINMQGSLSLGKEVLETISHYMKRSSSGRRSLNTNDKDSPIVKYTVDSANICRGMKICSGPLGGYVKDYLVLLGNAIESIFESILDKDDYETPTKGTIFLENFKPMLYSINDILKKSNDKYITENDLFEWVTIIKKISAKFQKSATAFVANQLDGNPKNIDIVKKKLLQKLIIAIVLVENKYEARLCKEFLICETEHEASKALNTLLGEFNNVENEKAMEFLKYFYENLPYHVFNFLGTETMHDLQVILSDLSYTKNSPAKEVLISVAKTVEGRLRFFKNNEELSKAYDQQLVNIILSDMDYFYTSKRRTYPFDNFLGPFTGWVRLGGKFSQQMKQVLKDITKKLTTQDPDLVEKVATEVRIFLELTVDVD